jgi:hypothetical protein
MTSPPRWRNPTVADISAAIAKEAGMANYDQPGDGWTIVLRRQPARIVAGQQEGGYTNLFELICCDCGDHPDQDHSEVSPELQRVRGPYSITGGVAAYKRHVRLHRHPSHATRAGMMTDVG